MENVREPVIPVRFSFTTYAQSAGLIPGASVAGRVTANRPYSSSLATTGPAMNRSASGNVRRDGPVNVTVPARPRPSGPRYSPTTVTVGMLAGSG